MQIKYNFQTERKFHEKKIYIRSNSKREEFLLRFSSLRTGTRLVSMRMQVGSLASLSGLRIQQCPKLWCRMQTALLDPALLWLCLGLAVAAQIQSLTWELPDAKGATLKSKEKKRETEAQITQISWGCKHRCK